MGRPKNGRIPVTLAIVTDAGMGVPECTTPLQMISMADEYKVLKLATEAAQNDVASGVSGGTGLQLEPAMVRGVLGPKLTRTITVWLNARATLTRELWFALSVGHIGRCC